MSAFDSTKKLTVVITGNTAGLNKSFGAAIREAEGFRAKMAVVGNTLKSMAGPAMIGAAAAAGAFAIKLGVDGVKAAMDEDRQLALLKQTLDNVGQGFAMPEVNTFIDNLRFATGVADDELRPALATIVGATKDAVQAQNLLAIAVDTSVGSGRDLQSVAGAIAKAVGGQTTALGRLVPGLDKAVLKSGDLNKVMGALQARFGGSATAAARTLEGQIERLKDGFQELQESFGHGFLDSLDGTTQGAGDLAQVLRELQPQAEQFGKDVGTLANALSGLGTIMNFVNGIGDMMPDWLGKTVNVARFVLDPISRVVQLLGFLAQSQADAARESELSAAKAEVQTQRLIASGKAAQLLEVDITAVTEATDSSTESTWRYSSAMASIATEAKITASRLGAVADAIAGVDDAVSHWEALQAYKQAIKDFVADPTKQGLVDIVSAAGDAATSFEDPTAAADFYRDALDKIIKLAQSEGLKLPPGVAASAQTAADSIGGARLEAEKLKQAMETIPTLVESQIRMYVTVNGKYYDPYGAYDHTATGGPVYATGGMVRAALGTHASDNIPAMLSRGEYVLNADAVRRLGVGTLNNLNNGGGMGGGFVINGGITVNSAPGERAEESVPRALRRLAFVAGLNG